MGMIGRALAGLALILALLAVLALVARAWQARSAPGLAPWHVFAPDEATAEAIAAMDWGAYVDREGALFDELREAVTDRLAPEYRTPENRYNPDSPLHAPGFATDWNRSFVLEPEGAPRGAAVLVHGLTDSPYSLRHLARLYRDEGFVAIVPRMPGHGTTPGGLRIAVWPQWMEATRLAVREAVERVGPEAPLHVVGYSNGGALVTKYAIEALEDPALARPDRVVLLSPMIGITRFARFAGLAGWPAVLPGFARAAWFDLIPEFNPFKYNSFPVQAAVQSYRLTEALRADLDRAARSGALARMPPVLTFQSVVDFTVSARAVVETLYARLPANGSVLVLADLNRAATLAPLFARAAEAELGRILPPRPRAYGVTVLGNAGPGDPAAVARTEPAGSGPGSVAPLGIDYPRDVFSLSHVALPFPPWDGLYGFTPDPADDFGLNIGRMASRGETGVVAVGSDMFARLYANPFFETMAARLREEINRP